MEILSFQGEIVNSGLVLEEKLSDHIKSVKLLLNIWDLA
jgi:hypothetical protein